MSNKTNYNDIKDIALVDFLDRDVEQTVPAHELWKDKPAVVIVIRRPGCQFCREEARIFHENRETIEQNMQGMNMFCIVHEKEGSDVFKNEFWKGKVYFDSEKAFYKALGGGQLRTGGWEQLIKPAFWGNFFRNKRSGVKGNFEGDGKILGGLLLVKANDGGIAYEHIEKVWGDIAHPDQVLEACSRVSGVALDKKAVAKAQQDHDALHDRMQQSSHSKGTNTSATDSNAAPTASAEAPATTTTGTVA
ncbi:hypothetical protein BGZ99_002617 [Dissophora globulifera]|uniref:Peroxiredoxin-like 2A n=1 Tax=Dissophora globulifera TaxID=979702 RepID=A0A9P6RS59_9FUNG|nr:hypothetical protein BGZ99_002617 [Dissophora globulifera]